MTLSNIIQSLPGWESKDAKTILEDLSATVEKVDATLYTGKHVIKVLNDENLYKLVAGTLQAAAKVNPLAEDARLWLGSGGLDFSDEKTVKMIDELAIAGGWPVELTTALKRIGRPVVTVFADKGGVGDLPTQEDVQSILDQLQLAELRQSKQIAAANRYNAYVDAIDQWDGVTQEPVL